MRITFDNNGIYLLILSFSRRFYPKRLTNEDIIEAHLFIDL